MEPPVDAAAPEQFRVRALLGDDPAVHDQDPVGPRDRREPVGDDEDRATGHQVVERGLHEALALGVERAGGLVEDQDRRVAEDRPGDGEPLALAAGEAHAALSDDRLVPLRQLADEAVGLGAAGGVSGRP